MIVLGIDPGPTWCGWALLDFSISTSPVWLCGAAEDNVPSLFDTLIASGKDGLCPTFVAVEQPRVMHKAEANVHVMATSWAGGEVAGYARAKGFAVMRLGVHEWQVALVGNSKRGDKVDHKVEAELRRIVRQMPVRTSVHARDAAGVACVAARKWRVSASQTVRSIL